MSIYNAMGIILRWKLFNYVIEIGIFKNSSQKSLVVLGGDFWELGWPKRHPDALLTMTMQEPIHA